MGNDTIPEAPTEVVALARRHSTEIDAPITNGEIDMLYRLGNGLSKSGMFKDARQADQAFAKLIFGRDLGLSATQAMTDIHIIEGKPEMSANLQASKVKASGKYDYRVLKLDADGCSIEFGRGTAPGKNEHGQWLPWPDAYGTSDFTQADAEAALLTKPSKNGAPSNYIKYPRNMFFARSMSNGVAWYCPDVMNGIRVYAEGEIVQATAVEVTEPSVNGSEPVEAEVVDGAAPAPADGPARISEEELAALTGALSDLGIDDNTLTMLLSSVGVDCTEDLTPALLDELRQALGAHLAKAGATS
jgi:hypothetical protein